MDKNTETLRISIGDLKDLIREVMNEDAPPRYSKLRFRLSDQEIAAIKAEFRFCDHCKRHDRGCGKGKVRVADVAAKFGITVGLVNAVVSGRYETAMTVAKKKIGLE